MEPHHHPVNISTYDNAGFGDRLADRVATRLGSWGFIVGQTLVILVWIALNVTAVVHHWDPYPFVFLNLLFSTQAAYAAPILQLAQNRQAKHDRIKAEHDYRVNADALRLIQAVHKEVVPREIGAPGSIAYERVGTVNTSPR